MSNTVAMYGLVDGRVDQPSQFPLGLVVCRCLYVDCEYTGWVKKVSCGTAIDISKARQ